MKERVLWSSFDLCSAFVRLVKMAFLFFNEWLFSENGFFFFFF